MVRGCKVPCRGNSPALILGGRRNFGRRGICNGIGLGQALECPIGRTYCRFRALTGSQGPGLTRNARNTLSVRVLASCVSTGPVAAAQTSGPPSSVGSLNLGQWSSVWLPGRPEALYIDTRHPQSHADENERESPGEEFPESKTGGRLLLGGKQECLYD